MKYQNKTFRELRKIATKKGKESARKLFKIRKKFKWVNIRSMKNALKLQESHLSAFQKNTKTQREYEKESFYITVASISHYKEMVRLLEKEKLQKI